MDLRRVLVQRLAAMYGVLLLAVGVAGWAVLRQDAAAEQAASRALVSLLELAARPDLAEADKLAAVRRQLASPDWRHVRITLEEEPPGEDAAASAPLHWPLGKFWLRIAPDPASEVAEKLHDGARLLLLLLLFVAISLGAVWYAVHRALSPVQALEAGLLRLQQGEDDPALPPLALREFQRIAHTIGGLGASLGEARRLRQELLQRLLTVQEDERSELARELHDEFGQSLAAMGASAAFIQRHAAQAPPEQLAECAAEIGNESRRIAGHVRSLLAALRPHGLDGLGMEGALAELLQSWQAKSPAIVVDSQLQPLPALPAATGLALYRCVQEALTNVRRHSQASRVTVRCALIDGAVQLHIADDGRGRVAALARARGCGLAGMRERVLLAGGDWQIHDREPQGLRIEVCLPLPAGLMLTNDADQGART